MMDRATTSCPNCEALERKITELIERIAALENELAKAKKNSRNSSKPPSSDITNPPKKRGGSGKKRGKRKRGGQHGHPRHEREPLMNPRSIASSTTTMTAVPIVVGESR